MKHIFYADAYAKRIARGIADNGRISLEWLRLGNPTFSRWGSWLSNKTEERKKAAVPSSSLLIGGNRWRHHFALGLTDLPIVVVDAHTDMSFDEMIFLRLVRPYNWLYFRLLRGLEAHLVLPYDSFRWRRWDIAVPEKYLDMFNLYAFDRKKFRVRVSLTARHFKLVEVKDPETCRCLNELNKQMSLDCDITREVPEERVEKLMATIARSGDVCDVWLDERRTFKDDRELCSRLSEILDAA